MLTRTPQEVIERALEEHGVENAEEWARMIVERLAEAISMNDKTGIFLDRTRRGLEFE